MSGRDNNRIQKRNKDIVNRFKELIDKKTARGKSVHSYAYCIETVADEFYLSEYWVAHIIRTHE